MAQDDKVTKYLDYYCKELENPGYAVMINGKWGSGKTWFVKQYLEGLDNKAIKSIYVSLYGLASTSDIDYAIFQKLHPFLTNKGMRLAGKVLGGMAKVALNFDMNGDGKNDTKTEFSASSLSHDDFLSIKENTIIVFDDLERCCIDTNKTLGYINHLIEHCSIKAIVVTDEPEIEKNIPPAKSKYLRTKEKVIGKTLIAPTRLEDAVSAFIDETTSNDVKQILSENLPIISRIHEQSSYKNLRSLRHSILDFERLYKSLPDFSRKDKAFTSHVLRVLLILSYETRQHYITPEEITTLHGDHLFNAIQENNPDSKPQKLKEKYAPLNLSELGLSASDWSTFFKYGFIDKKHISESIEKNTFFYSKNLESWIKLWYYSDLSDDEFSKSLHDVESDIESHTYDDIGVILHLAGIFFSLSTHGIIKDTPGEILTKFKDYLSHIHTSGKVQSSTYKLFRQFDDSYKGLSFQAREYPLYKELFSFAKSICESSMNEQLKRDADIVPNEILTDLDGFINKLDSNSFENHLTRRNPLLKYIQAHDFFDAFMKLKPNDRRRVLFALVNRYHDDFHHNLYQSERPFLLEFRSKLAEYSTNHVGKLSGLQCKWHINTLNDDIFNLKPEESTTS